MELGRGHVPRDRSLRLEASERDNSANSKAETDLLSLKCEVAIGCVGMRAIGVRCNQTRVVHSRCGPCALSESLVPLCERESSRMPPRRVCIHDPSFHRRAASRKPRRPSRTLPSITNSPCSHTTNLDHHHRFPTLSLSPALPLADGKWE